MGNEITKSLPRRLADHRFVSRYFVGKGIDIGCGNDSLAQYSWCFPLVTSIKSWDIPDGDAQHMSGVENETFDFIVSSHCLEHLHDPYESMTNWCRILKPGGYMVIVVPDEDLYEQRNWPSRYNRDHKTTWTIQKTQSWSPVSINVTNFLSQFPMLNVLKLELCDSTYNYGLDQIDQTLNLPSESAIEIILRKI